MSKRKKYFISSLVATIWLVVINLSPLEYRYWLIAGLSLANLLLLAWSTGPSWKGIVRVATGIMLLMYSAGAGMFTFLLPDIVPGLWLWSWGAEAGRWVSWLLRAVFWLAAFNGFYSIFSTANIYAVATMRAIALARAAVGIGFFITLVIGFFSYNALWSFRLPFYWNFLGVFLISWPLVWQAIWSVNIRNQHNWQMVLVSGVYALIIAQLALVFSFWPVIVGMASLALTAALYVLVGLAQFDAMKKLFTRTTYEYLLVGLGVFITIYSFTSWRN